MQAIVTRALCDHCLDLPVAVPGTHPHSFMKNGESYVERHNAKWEGPFIAPSAKLSGYIEKTNGEAVKDSD